MSLPSRAASVEAPPAVSPPSSQEEAGSTWSSENSRPRSPTTFHHTYVLAGVNSAISELQYEMKSLGIPFACVYPPVIALAEGYEVRDCIFRDDLLTEAERSFMPSPAQRAQMFSGLVRFRQFLESLGVNYLLGQKCTDGLTPLAVPSTPPPRVLPNSPDVQCIVAVEALAMELVRMLESQQVSFELRPRRIYRTLEGGTYCPMFLHPCSRDIVVHGDPTKDASHPVWQDVAIRVQEFVEATGIRVGNE